MAMASNLQTLVEALKLDLYNLERCGAVLLER